MSLLDEELIGIKGVKLETLEDCARAAFARYNGRNDRAPDRAPRTDDEV